MNWSEKDLAELPSPCYVIDLDILEANLELMQKRCTLLGIKPLLSIKGFPLAHLFEDIAPYLFGLSAASLFEARLGQRMGKEVHIHAPAYRPDEFGEIMELCDHIVFNSIEQWERYREAVLHSGRNISCGLRINPEYSEIETNKYNPCLPGSRFGVTEAKLCRSTIAEIEGFHMHALCDQGAETLTRVVAAMFNKFEKFLPSLSWINFGGGHQLADADYRFELLREPISKLRLEYGLEVYVEPCEAIVTSAGFLVSTVLEIVSDEKPTAILDTSAICHMPDVLEMPYRPDVISPANDTLGGNTYILAGVSCLPGDIIGEYEMKEPLHLGDKIIFSDMGAYTFAKENYFNGINYPTIAVYSKKEGMRIVKSFNYSDYEAQYY